MRINMIADDSVAGAPAGFVAAINTAAAMITRSTRANITLNIRFGWGSFNNVVDNTLTGSGGAYANILGSTSVSFANLKTLLQANATTSDTRQAVATLPATSAGLPSSLNLDVGLAQEKALGLIDPNSAGVDGAVAFGTAVPSTAWIGVALHEISHAMGRLTAYYRNTNNQTGVIEDLYRFSAAGTYNWTGGQAAYISLDGGTTDLADYSTTSDYSDLVNNSRAPNDPNDAFYTGSTTQALTALDARTLDLIGFGRVARQSDYYGNGTSDILLRDTRTGGISDWELLNGAYVQSQMVGGMGSNVQIVGTGDFNSSGTTGVLLRDTTTGAISDWTFQRGLFSASTQLGGVGSSIQVAGVGDFNGDGNSDILLRDTASGAVTVWTVNPNNTFGGSSTLGLVDPGTQIAGVGVFNRADNADILLRDSGGTLTFWSIQNNAFTGSHTLGRMGANIQIVGTGDFAGNGNDDILLRDTISGALTYWALNSDGTFNRSVTLGGVGSNIQVVGPRDVNGDGIPDVLLRDTTTGAVTAWTISGGQFNQSVSLGGVGGNIQIAG